MQHQNMLEGPSGHAHHWSQDPREVPHSCGGHQQESEKQQRKKVRPYHEKQGWFHWRWAYILHQIPGLLPARWGSWLPRNPRKVWTQADSIKSTFFSDNCIILGTNGPSTLQPFININLFPGDILSTYCCHKTQVTYYLNIVTDLREASSQRFAPIRALSYGDLTSCGDPRGNSSVQCHIWFCVGKTCKNIHTEKDLCWMYALRCCLSCFVFSSFLHLFPVWIP